MAYAISVDGVNALFRLNPWLKAIVSGEPIVGLVDGSNKIFHIANPPAEDGSIVIKDAAGAVITPASVNADTGEIELSSAATERLWADYTHTTLQQHAYDGVVVDGFSLMERLVPRGWYLVVDTGGDNETYISSDPSSIVDPLVNGQPFSQSIVETRFYENCANFQLITSLYREAAYHNILVREERTGGLQIDRSKNAKAFEDMIETMWPDLKEQADQIADNSGVTRELGTAIAGTISDYTYDTHWWQGSTQQKGVIP